MALHLPRRQQRLLSNPSLIRFLSNSSPDLHPNVVNAPGETPSQSSSHSSSPFADIKTNLKQKLQHQQEQGTKPFDGSDAHTQAQNRGSIRSSNNQSRGFVQDLGKNLAKFQRRSIVQPSRDSGGALQSQSRPQISFEALYKQNAVPNSTDPSNSKPQDFHWNNVWDNIKKMKTQSNTSNTFNSNVFPGTEVLRKSVFGKEMDERKGRQNETDFLTFYSEEKLGEKLRMLRPEGNKEEGWFSLQELNQRLVKLRQVEEKESQTRVVNYGAIRNFIGTIANDTLKNEVNTQQNRAIMGHFGPFGAIAEYKLHPPKDYLVETYFHPDNMSSAEKMKTELTKVREDFKMSESDCGSARVQVAQLTTKIKHLSSVLHKKDKHSRKGLVAMVQKRKKLLNYLRRTDWDSYCLVLSKLSLRDKQDDKYKNYAQV